MQPRALAHHKRQHHCAVATASPQQRSWGAQQAPCKAAERCCASRETVSGKCYEEIIDQLAQSALRAAVARGPTEKYVVGIAGGPGSGKSTLSVQVRDRINQLQPGTAQGRTAEVVPMDGFHYYKAELDRLPDPKLAYARRGAHWTFNAAKFVSCVRQLKELGQGKVPSFDHAEGDPREDDVTIAASTRVLLVEGNYLLLDLDPWRQLRPLFDQAWFVDCPLDVAMARVFARQTGIGLAPEVSLERIRTNDRPNAEEIALTKQHATLLVDSTVPFCREE